MTEVTGHEKVTISPCDSDKITMGDSDHEPRLLEVNAAGDFQKLEQNFSLFSICSVGIVTGNTWAALGGSIAVAI